MDVAPSASPGASHPAPTGERAGPSAARLELSDPLGRHRVVLVDRTPFTIGRSHQNALSLLSADISREHAEIVRDGEVFRLRDRGSRTGTFVNGVAVQEQTLAHGDRIRIGGHSELVFLIGEGRAVREGTTTSVVSDLRLTAALLETLRALGSARMLEHVLAMVLDSAIMISGAERGFIMLASADGELEFKLGRGRDRTLLPGARFQTSRKIPEGVFRTGESRVIADLQEGELAAAHSATVALGIRTVLCVPLKLIRYAEAASAAGQEHCIGVLYLDSREKGALQSRSTVLALETLAIEAAVAIDSARLYRESQEKAELERELRMAYEFQQALLPKAAPARWFVSAAAEMAPCQAIGGDFYDYLDFGETAVGFTIGDVAGKGVAAGLLGARVQEIFAACASPGIDPATTLAAINRVLVRRGLEARFVTLFFGVLRDDGRLAYCNAGHNPPLVIGRHGVRRLDRGGMILGLFQDATYECGDTVLEPGEALVAFSDGICEACNPEGEPFGDQRILDCITVHGHREEPRMLLEQLFAAVRHFSAGASPGDDMTGLIIRYCR